MKATDVMRTHNPHAAHAVDQGKEIFVEDVTDPDGRLFRIEYRCNADGTNATAYVLRNPWSGNPYTYVQSHLSNEGFVCIGKGVSPSSSPYALDYAIRQARIWCAGYSFLRGHSYEETCRVFPEWGGGR